MTVSKRALFGIAAGGAVAGPSMAKSLVAEVSSGQYAGTALDYGAYQAKCDPNIPVAIGPQERIRHLMERRNRLTTHGASSERIGNNEQGLASHYDALRSVAINPRRLMYSDAVDRRHLARELHWVDEEIAALKKQLGPLGWVLT